MGICKSQSGILTIHDLLTTDIEIFSQLKMFQEFSTLTSTSHHLTSILRVIGWYLTMSQYFKLY